MSFLCQGISSGYEVPSDLKKLLAEHGWMQIHWLEEDFGPGTKVLGVVESWYFLLLPFGPFKGEFCYFWAL